MLIEDNATLTEMDIEDNNYCLTVDGKLTVEIVRQDESYKIMLWRVPVDSDTPIHTEVVPDFALIAPEEAKETAAGKKTDSLYDPPKMPFDYTMDEAFEIMRYMQCYDRYGEILSLIENKDWYKALSDENKRKAVNYLASSMVECYAQTEDSEYYYDEQIKEDISILLEDMKEGLL